MAECVHNWVLDWKLKEVFCFECTERLDHDQVETRLNEYDKLKRDTEMLLQTDTVAIMMAADELPKTAAIRASLIRRLCKEIDDILEGIK